MKVNGMILKAAEVGAISMALAGTALATHNEAHVGAADAKPRGTATDLFGGGGSFFQQIANTLIYIVGAVAVIMLIIGGFRYVLSSGNASSVEGAKNTILYAIIGIVVAVISFAIVNFVLTRIG